MIIISLLTSKGGKVNLKRTIVYVDEGDKERRRKVEESVSNVLATYPNSVLVEADEGQIESLKNQKLRLEIQEGAQIIRLRTVEFDTLEGAPSVPPALKLSAAEVKKERGNYWVVQFVGPAKAEWRKEIEALGGRLHNLIPENAFLVGMTPQIKEKVEKLPFVNWVGLYEPTYKVSPLLMGRKKKVSPSELGTLSLSTEAFKPTPQGNINISLHDPAERQKVSREIEKLGGTIITSGKGTIRASLDLSKVDKVAKMAEVKWIEPYVVPELFNDIATQIIGVQPVWDNHGLDGEEQIVAVADTGLDTGVNDATMHDDFEGRIVDIHSWAIPVGLHQYLDNTSWDDGPGDHDSGHGTHVSGSVLGNGAKLGNAIRGMAFKARLVFQAVEQFADWKPWTGYPDGYYLLGIPDDLNDLFQQAYNDGARIHTNSWGGVRDAQGNLIYGQYTASSQYIDEFMWDHKDMIILFAAANEGQDANHDGVVDLDSLSVQASAKNCISVGASENNRPSGSTPPPGYDIPWGTGSWAIRYPVDPINSDHVSDDPEGMAAFSSRGPTDDGRVKPDVVAPGTNILSVRSSVAAGTGWGLLPAGDPNQPYYMYMGGTSMATPITAGTVALIRQYLVKACLHNNPSGALLKALLIHGASPLTGQYTPREVGGVPDNNQGWGRVNLEGSLFSVYPIKLEFRDNPADTLGTGENKDFSFKVVNNTVPLRATLVWTDYPSDPATGGGLVNTLRLAVTSPDGLTTLYGLPANNNVQQVVIDNPQIGLHQVRVQGINVTTEATTGERQDFALLVSGGLEFVDVYIKDNYDDNGIPPSKGCLYLSPDIWVSLDNDPNALPAYNPEYGQTNYVFVRVHNRGTKAANNAEVKLYWAKGGTNLSQPYWKTDGIKVDGVLGNVRYVDVPAHNATGDGEAITAAFEWSPPNPETYEIEPGHFCLFATVNHSEDPILQQDVTVVRWEDNLAWKNVNVKNMLPDTESGMEFYVAGIEGASSTADLHIDGSALPAGGTVKLKVPSRFLEDSTMVNLHVVWESEGGLISQVEVTSDKTADIMGISLKPNENTLVRLEVTLPEDARDGDVYPIFVEQKVNGIFTGRVTLVARAVGAPAYIANCNPRSRELHLANCFWVGKMLKGHKVPYDDLEAALRRGYDGCRFCLPEYHTR